MKHPLMGRALSASTRPAFVRFRAATSLAVLALALVPAFARAQASTATAEATPAAAPAAPSAEAPCCLLPQGTVLQLEIHELINSSRHKRGDKFALRVAEPVKLGEDILIPAGAAGVGEVVHAAASRGGGKPGELLLAGRYVEFGGRQWSLRGMKVSATGENNYGLAFGLSTVLGPFAMFTRGHEIEVPPGTRVTAKLAQDLRLPALSATELAAWPAGTRSEPNGVAPTATEAATGSSAIAAPQADGPAAVANAPVAAAAAAAAPSAAAPSAAAPSAAAPSAAAPAAPATAGGVDSLSNRNTVSNQE